MKVLVLMIMVIASFSSQADWRHSEEDELNRILDENGVLEITKPVKIKKGTDSFSIKRWFVEENCILQRTKKDRSQSIDVKQGVLNIKSIKRSFDGACGLFWNGGTYYDCINEWTSYRISFKENEKIELVCVSAEISRGRSYLDLEITNYILKARGMELRAQ